MRLSIKHILLTSVCTLLGLVSCSNDPELKDPTQTETPVPDRITLNITVPEFTVEELSTRGDNTFKTITALCFNSAGEYLSQETVRLDASSVSSGSFEFTVGLHKMTHTLEFVTDMEPTAAEHDLTGVIRRDPNLDIMWGRASLSNLLAKPVSERTVQLLRYYAKVSVASPVSGFISRFGVYATAAMGTIAPSERRASPTSPSLPDNVQYGWNVSRGLDAMVAADREVRIFETPKGRGVIIIEGNYNGKKGYYTVAFRKRSGSGNSETPGAYDYTPVDVVRNHHYKVTITDVRAEGWPTWEEALNAEPDNRITVQITDSNMEIDDIIATRDYELGVSSEVDVDCDATEAVLNVVTSWANGDKPALILTDNAAWVKTEGLTLPPHSNVSTGVANRGGKRFVITVPIEANNGQEERKAAVTVRSGQLERTITITQGGRDYRRDTKRKVTYKMGSSTITADYYTWVVSTLKGAAPEDFHQANMRRDDGLIFPSVNAYTAEYTIPVLSGDNNAHVTGSGFSMTSSATAYTIKWTGSTQPGITIGEFSVTNSQGVTITYPLYRTGYIHQLTASHSSWQPAGKAIQGWFYYEVVKTPDGSGWTLDRNIGASCNKPYITTHAGFRDNQRAIGAYFKIADTKCSSYTTSNSMLQSNSTVTDRIGLGSWKAPTRTQIEKLQISYRDYVSGSEHAYIARFSSRDSKVNPVYLPHGGYYESETPKLITHACLWTRTLVSGSQGFSQTSPEFGYWYQYFDFYSTKPGFSNMRIANGSAGQAPDAGAVFKYMPLRPFWNN
ncbi:MAG: hypothetical protein K2M87_01585 [Muribaculaceae bacterium]|nr:hypothetical protein [Muribaculaceae bacterium]